MSFWPNHFCKLIRISSTALSKYALRTDEIQKMCSILAKRRNRNILIWGDFGLGKSTLINQLMVYLLQDTCPKNLCAYQLYELDYSITVQDDATISSVFTNIRELFYQDSKSVLVINNLENYLGIGSKKFEKELQLLLSNPSTCIIATVDTDEVSLPHKPICNMFWEIHLYEPTLAEVYEMIPCHLHDLEQYHNVHIDLSLAKWISCCSEYFCMTCEPKRSIDLIDAVMAHAANSGHTTVSKSDFFDFLSTEMQRYYNLSEEQKRNTAIHELGHFFVHLDAEETLCITPTLVCIIPSVDYDGITSAEHSRIYTPSYDTEFYVRDIATSLAGRVAEEIFNVPTNSGAKGDLDEANEIAENFVSIAGMNEDLMGDKVSDSENNDDGTVDIMMQCTNLILEKARDYATEVIIKYKDLIEEVIPHLIKNNGLLTREEIEYIMMDNSSK